MFEIRDHYGDYIETFETLEECRTFVKQCEADFVQDKIENPDDYGVDEVFNPEWYQIWQRVL